MRAWLRPACHIRRLHALHRRPFSYSRAQLERVSVAQLLSREIEAEDVDLYGWVRSVRRQKKVAFAAIGDGTTIDHVQAVLKPEDTTDLSTGAAVKLTGDWRASAGKGQSHELQVTEVKALGDNDAEHNPLQPKYQTPEFLRTIPHLRPRIPANTLLLRLRSQVIVSITRFFNEHDFVQCHTPIITSSDCEGAGEVFTLSSNEARDSEHQAEDGKVEPFFRTPKYLTVSSQLHLEALAQAVDRVWTLSPTFRAEKSDTPRHLSEFYMLEAELCFTDDLEIVMKVVERMLMEVAFDLLSRPPLGNELLKSRDAAEKAEPDESRNSTNATTLKTRWEGLAAGEWPCITYAEAIKVLEKADTSFDFKPSYKDGLQAEHERYVAGFVGEGKPVFVTDYPKAQKPFYMPPSRSTANSRGMEDTVACFDLLVPDLCELVGGSLREHRLPELQSAMESKGVAGNNLEWYKDLRRYGSVPHGGFGLGFDRLLCYLSGVNNVRDVVAFPRWYGRCDA